MLKRTLCGKAAESHNVLRTLKCISNNLRLHIYVRVYARVFSRVQPYFNETHQTQREGEEEKWCWRKS